MLTTIIGALLPIVVILLLGFFSAWHKDFNADQATVLNRMVMLYQDAEKLFFEITTLLASPENKGLAGAEASKNRRFSTFSASCYALPLLLFGSTISISRSQLQADVPLALAVAAGMVGSFFIVLLIGPTDRQRKGGQALHAFSRDRCCS